MEIHLIASSEFDRAQQIWIELEQKIKNIAYNQQWVYVQNWLGIYGDIVPHWFLYATENDVPVGIILFTKHIGRNIGLPVKSFSIGPDGESYSERVQLVHNTILSYPKLKEAFISDVFKAIVKEFKWEEINIEALSEDEALLLSEALIHVHKKFITKSEKEYIFDLQRVREEKKDVLSLLDYDIRYRIRRSIRAFGEVTLEWAETEKEAYDIFDEMIALHQNTWTKRGRKGVFSSDRFNAFHQNLIKTLLPQKKVGLVRVSSSRLGTIGCLYFFIEGKSIYGCQCGFAQFTQDQFPEVNINRIKPGYITHALCMEESAKRGYDIYSFGTGFQIYKKELSNAIRTQVSLQVFKGIKPKIRQVFLDQYLKLDNANSRLIKPIYKTYKIIHDYL